MPPVTMAYRYFLAAGWSVAGEAWGFVEMDDGDEEMEDERGAHVYRC
jgi:hypothetical protein